MYYTHMHECMLQIGEEKADHDQYLRCEKDNVTPRTNFVSLPPKSPGADLLYQAAAAYAAGALALETVGGSAQLAQRATAKATEIFKRAEAVPGLYSEHLGPRAGQTYPNDGWESFGFWAASWLHRLTKEETYKAVCCLSRPRSSWTAL